MKVEIKETETKFEPITITLTIESEEELCDLWHRANVKSNAFQKGFEYIPNDYLKHGLMNDPILHYELGKLVAKHKLNY